MAQFSLDQKIFNFPTFGGTKDTWPTEQKTPKTNHHSLSHLLELLGSALSHPSGNSTLSHQPSSWQLSPLETVTFGILSHHVTFTPLFLSLPSFWKMNHCTLPASQLFCAALFPALTIIKGPLHVVAVPHECTPIFQTNSCLVFITPIKYLFPKYYPYPAYCWLVIWLLSIICLPTVGLVNSLYCIPSFDLMRTELTQPSPSTTSIPPNTSNLSG